MSSEETAVAGEEVETNETPTAEETTESTQAETTPEIQTEEPVLSETATVEETSPEIVEKLAETVEETALSEPIVETTEVVETASTEATEIVETATSETETSETKSETIAPQPAVSEPKPVEAKPKPRVVLKPKTTEKAPVQTEKPVGTAKVADAPEVTDDDDDAAPSDFGAILEQFEQEQSQFRSGDVVRGEIVGVTERGVMISFGYKSEGMVNPAEFMQAGEMTAQIGEEVEVVIKQMDGGDGVPELSRSEAQKMRSWETLEKAFNEGTIVKGRVLDRVKGGLSVDIEGVEAFLPGSLIDSYPIRNLDSYKGQELEAKVIKFNRKRSNVVLSRKVITDEVVEVQKGETLARLAEGYIVDGKIKSLAEYGAFVDLGGIDGLLHVTDMSWSKLDRPSQMFKVGDEVQVKVLKFDLAKERVSLGLKQLVPDPWASLEERFPINSKFKGRVSSVTDYGAFVEVEPNVEGLVHVSEMSWSKRAKHPKNIVAVGDQIEVQVLSVDPKERRISLGMRQSLPNPWETVHERYKIGMKVSGRIRNVTDFGGFVEIEDGVDGLVHVSDISWSKKIKHPGDVLKKNQEVEAVVLKIDAQNRRLSLSMKDLMPSAWDNFVTTHKPGDIVKGKISRFASFGVFVELGDDLEGLCHISELSDERVEDPKKIVEIGQEMDFKILRIEHDVRKIGLSHRSVGREDEPIVDTKSYSTEAKGGMASLAELANLTGLGGSSSDEK